MTVLEIIATVVGGFAAAIYIVSYQCRKRKWILFLGALSRTLFILQYILLGAFSGAVLDLIAILAALLAEKKERPTVKKLFIPIIIFNQVHNKQRRSGTWRSRPCVQLCGILPLLKAGPHFRYACRTT